MCEPMHSVSQWPTEEAAVAVVEKIVEKATTGGDKELLAEINKYRLTGKRLLPDVGDIINPHDLVGQWDADSTTLERIQMAFGPAAKFTRQVDEFFHLSRFGEGHAESRYSRLGGKTHLLPPPTCYEIAWWSRDVRFDGELQIPRKIEQGVLAQVTRDAYKEDALAACTEYAMRTSIGSLGTLRRFLEETIMTTKCIGGYEDPLRKLLSDVGYENYVKRLAIADIQHVFTIDTDNDQKKRLVKVICGMTRVRRFMCPAWAEIDSLWSEKKKGGKDDV